MTGGVSLSAGRCARRATEAGLGCGASWAEGVWAARGSREELGRRGVGFGLVPGEGKRPGEEWVWAGLGREVGCGLGFVLGFSFLFLIQTKTSN
jgi:hypothetical protein